ncbi:hypothetical protein BGZ54_000934 [Gamsiella multidivaricata]|nr:hypothetical protein BGZ54_000934 [Gamsiella multidivaricata]
MSVGTVVPFINDFLVINGDASTTIGGPVPEGRTKVVVLEFWATIPHLSELQRKYKDVDVTIVGATNEKDEQLHPLNSTYLFIIEVFKASGATGIPFAAVVVNNKIVFSGHPMDPQFAKTLEDAASKASSTRKEPVALPLVTQTYEELMQLRPKELRQILEDRGIRTTGCSEKGDFAKLIVETYGPKNPEMTNPHSKDDHPHPSPVKIPREELMHMHPRDLLHILDERHIDHKGAVEKDELVDLILTKCSH